MHLRILQTKLQKSRLVPLQPTAAALEVYLHRRQALGYHALSDVVFVAERGDPLDVGLLGVWFSKLTCPFLPIVPQYRACRDHMWQLTRNVSLWCNYAQAFFEYLVATRGLPGVFR